MSTKRSSTGFVKINKNQFQKTMSMKRKNLLRSDKILTERPLIQIRDPCKAVFVENIAIDNTDTKEVRSAIKTAFHEAAAIMSESIRITQCDLFYAQTNDADTQTWKCRACVQFKDASMAQRMLHLPFPLIVNDVAVLVSLWNEYVEPIHSSNKFTPQFLYVMRAVCVKNTPKDISRQHVLQFMVKILHKIGRDRYDLVLCKMCGNAAYVEFSDPSVAHAVIRMANYLKYGNWLDVSFDRLRKNATIRCWDPTLSALPFFTSDGDDTKLKIRHVVPSLAAITSEEDVIRPISCHLNFKHEGNIKAFECHDKFAENSDSEDSISCPSLRDESFLFTNNDTGYFMDISKARHDLVLDYVSASLITTSKGMTCLDSINSIHGGRMIS